MKKIKLLSPHNEIQPGNYIRRHGTRLEYLHRAGTALTEDQVRFIMETEAYPTITRYFKAACSAVKETE